MKALAAYILGGQAQAVSVAIGFALVGLVVPLLGIPGFYLSSAAIALVSLVRGPANGLQNFAIATVAMAVLLQLASMVQLASGGFMVGIGVALVVWLPAWVMSAWLLRRNMSMTLLLSGILAAGMICGLFLFGDPVAALEKMFKAQMSALSKQGGVTQQQVSELKGLLESYARIGTGVVLGSVVTLNFMGLIIARAWQSVLFKPGAFSQEFSQLRLGSIAAWVTVAVIAATVVAPAGKFADASLNLMFVALSVFLFQGLALVQAYATNHRFSNPAIILIYVLVLIPPLNFIGAVLGLVDNWFHFRRHRPA
jgi:hypothetical protein